MGWQIFTEQHKDLRQILFHTYRVVYHYQPNTITVITIQYQTRPPENIPQLKDFKI
jgi:mRNA-degrading endonuclease RelE of RelBE toxin-antitoxin system